MADVEKGVVSNPPLDSDSPPEPTPITKKATAYDAAINVDGQVAPQNKFLALSYRLEHFLGFEARGIRRVKEKEQTQQTTLNFWQIVMMWFSINAAAQNITLGSIGYSVFELGFVDATLCSVFGGIVGSIPVAYTAGWGPWSGNRTMVSHSTPLVSK